MAKNYTNMQEIGETIEIKQREIEIYNIKLVNLNQEQNEVKFIVSCSKGTYIRSLCEDIAERLGTVGYMKDLNRTKVGQFKLEDAITLEELESNKEIIQKKIITMEILLKDLPKIKLNSNQLQRFLNGVKIKTDKQDGLYNIYEQKYIGTATIENGILKRDVIINL